MDDETLVRAPGWYTSRAGVQTGPHTRQRVEGWYEQGALAPWDFAWPAGDSGWRTLQDVFGPLAAPASIPAVPMDPPARSSLGVALAGGTCAGLALIALGVAGALWLTPARFDSLRAERALPSMGAPPSDAGPSACR